MRKASILIPALLFFFIIIFLSCDKSPPFSGYLWYGQKGKIASLDLAEMTISYPKSTGNCHEVGSEWTGGSFSFVCDEKERSRLYDFSLSSQGLLPTMADMKKRISDPHLSIDGARTLFRVKNAGEVYDVHLLFKGSGHGPIASNLGAATFGPDNRSLFLGQNNLVAAHVIPDISHPEVSPDAGLKAIVKGPGVVRDIHFSLAGRRLAICSGSKVLVCDQSGKSLRTVFDAAEGKLPGPLRLPYRVRWSDDGTKLAVIVSPDRKQGAFVIVDINRGKYKLIDGARPEVGGFAWTVQKPSALR